MLAAALEAEVDAYLAAFAELATRVVTGWCVRNGHAPPARDPDRAGEIQVVRPRVDDRRVDPVTGQRQQFQQR